MLNIAVCDDPVFLAQIRELLDRDERVGMVSLYRSPEDFLGAVDAGAGDELDAVLMDISFEEWHSKDRPAGRLGYDGDKHFCKEGNPLSAELRKRKTAKENPDCV